MEEITMPKTEIKFKLPTKWGMLHVKKAHILKGWHFHRVPNGIQFSQHTVEAACLSRQCGKVFSVICSVLSTLQYLSYVAIRSSSSILRGKQSTVATLETRERVWGREGCWFGGEWFSLYMKTLHFLSLAQINTAKNSYIHEPVTSQPHFTKWLKKKKKKNTDAATHTFTHTHKYLKSGLRKNNKFIQQQNSTDGICCDNIQKTFKREHNSHRLT